MGDNLEESRVQAKVTLVELTSISTSASAFPESFGLWISPKGRWIIASNSTSLYIIRTQDLPRIEARAFQVRQKPSAVAITDEAGVFALVSKPHQIDVYKFGAEQTGKLSQTLTGVASAIHIVHQITSITLDPEGKILAAAHATGIELISLIGGNVRRTINCDVTQHLSFSADGRTILATGLDRRHRTSTIISVGGDLDGPISEEGDLDPVPSHRAWITQIIFPDTRLPARQSSFLPDPTSGHAGEIIAFDPNDHSWGIFELSSKEFLRQKMSPSDNLRWRRDNERLEDALPAVTLEPLTVAVATKKARLSEIRVFQFDRNWRQEFLSGRANEDMGQTFLEPEISVEIANGDASFNSISALKWLQNGHCPQNRLIALTSSSGRTTTDDAMGMPLSGARIYLVDLEPSRSSQQPEMAKWTLNLDEVMPRTSLEYEDLPWERELDLARSLTRVQRRRESYVSIGRGSRTPRRSLSSSGLGFTALREASEHELHRRRSMSSVSLTSGSDDIENSGASPLPIDEPYTQGQPRSQFSINRAATAAANSAAVRRHLRALPNRPLSIRRADNLPEHPHESDADNWVPPPPPYSRDPDPHCPLPVQTVQGIAAVRLEVPSVGPPADGQPTAVSLQAVQRPAPVPVRVPVPAPAPQPNSQPTLQLAIPAPSDDPSSHTHPTAQQQPQPLSSSAELTPRPGAYPPRMSSVATPTGPDSRPSTGSGPPSALLQGRLPTPPTSNTSTIPPRVGPLPQPIPVSSSNHVAPASPPPPRMISPPGPSHASHIPLSVRPITQANSFPVAGHSSIPQPGVIPHPGTFPTTNPSNTLQSHLIRTRPAALPAELRDRALPPLPPGEMIQPIIPELPRDSSSATRSQLRHSYPSLTASDGGGRRSADVAPVAASSQAQNHGYAPYHPPGSQTGRYYSSVPSSGGGVAAAYESTLPPAVEAAQLRRTQGSRLAKRNKEEGKCAVM